MYLRPKTFTQKLPKDCPITHDPWLLHFVTKSFFRCQCQNQRRDKSWWNSGRNSRGTVQIRLMTQKPIGRGKIYLHWGSCRFSNLENNQGKWSWQLWTQSTGSCSVEVFMVFAPSHGQGFYHLHGLRIWWISINFTIWHGITTPWFCWISMAARWPFPTYLALTSLELWRNSVKASQVWQLETRCEVEAC